MVPHLPLWRCALVPDSWSYLVASCWEASPSWRNQEMCSDICVAVQRLRAARPLFCSAACAPLSLNKSEMQWMDSGKENAYSTNQYHTIAEECAREENLLDFREGKEHAVKHLSVLVFKV